MTQKKPGVKAGGGGPPPTDNPVNDAQNWNNNLGSTIGGFVTALVQADGEAKDAYTARVLNLLKVPNAEFVADCSVIGQKAPLQVRIDAPVIAITRTEPILIDAASIEMEMNVASSVNDSSQTDTEAKGSGSASVGWGPFKAQISVSASMACKSEHTRSSDFRSRTTCKVSMVQGEAPEGLSLIMKSVHKFIDTTVKINEAIIDAQIASTVKEATTDASKNVAPTSKS